MGTIYDDNWDIPDAEIISRHDGIYSATGGKFVQIV